LRIGIQNRHPMAATGEFGRQKQHSRGFSGAALGIGESDD